MNNFRHIMKATAVLFFLAVSLGREARADVKVTISKAVEVRDDYIRLGDVATVEVNSSKTGEIETILLGKAPAGAGVRTLSQLQIKARILAFGVSENNLRLEGASEVRISRPAAIKTASAPFVEREACLPLVAEKTESKDIELQTAVSDAMNKYVIGVLKHPKARVKVEILGLSGLTEIPAGARGLAVSRTAPMLPTGQARAELSVIGDDGKSLGTVAADVQVMVEVPVMVVKERINRNRVIEPDMIEVRYVNIESARTAIRNVSQVIGKRAKVNLAAGQILAQGAIVVPPVVQRGQTVVVEARIGSMVVRHYGRALDDAGVGELVMIRNSASNGQYPARVGEDGTLSLVQ